MKIKLSKSFFPLLEVMARYLILCGGRGSGKSEFAARKIFYRCMKEGGHRFLVLRKVRKTLQESCVRVIRTLLAENKINYSYNKTDRTITFLSPSGKVNEIIFDGLDEREKIKSWKAATSVWLEELTEFTRDDFMEIDLILREPTTHYKQIMATFNPDEARAPWVKKLFFDQEYPDSYVHRSTVLDNPIREIREQYLRILENLDDEVYRDIYLYGEWAFAKGQIFNWDVVPLPEIAFDERFYGGDFGYSVDPAALIRIYRKSLEFWLEELIYETGLTNPALGRKMVSEGVGPEDDVYFDSAEPKSIDEINDMEGLNVKPSLKGPDSVRAGIDYMKSVKIHIVKGSENLIRERGKYKWKVDRDGKPTNEPVKFEDHGMSAARYGIYTHMKAAGVGFGVIEQDVYPEI
jgi:phage terminase large subunit